MTADSTRSNSAPTTTREAEVARVAALVGTFDDLLARWSGTALIEKIPDDEWGRSHAGRCARCGKEGRLYASGWSCDDHKPGAAA